METIIRKCSNDGFDDIWLGFENEYPHVALLINHDFACIHYFESEGNETEEAFITFIITGEISKMPGYTVVSLLLAKRLF